MTGFFLINMYFPFLYESTLGKAFLGSIDRYFMLYLLYGVTTVV